MTLTSLISLYLLSAVIAVVFCAVQTRTLNGSNYTRVTLLLSFAICFYILGYTMELNSSTSSQILFWNRIEYIGIPFVSALWLTAGLMYTGYFSHHKKILFLAIYAIPITTFILRLTNDYHHLYFSSVEYIEEYGNLFFIKHIGPWMYVQLFHSMSMILISMWFFIYDFIKNSEKQMREIFLIAVASAFAVVGLILMQIKPFGLQIDYMAMCLPVTCILVIMAISRYDFLRTKSIARSKVFEASSDAILIINQQNKILDYNNSAKRLFEQLDIRLDNKTIPMLPGNNVNLLEALKKKGSSVVKLMLNGEECYFNITSEKIDYHKELNAWIKAIRDVTEIYKLNEELNKQAMTDELSVLSNRRAFIKIGKEWILKSEESGNSLHLLMMDLDHFKDVNDQYGHPTGDLVIREFAQMLKNHFDSNCLIARLGGEEFAILFSGFNDEEILNMINSLLAESERRTYSYFGNKFHVTVSIGVTKRQPGQMLESMLRKADNALYESKNRGRSCITVL